MDGKTKLLAVTAGVYTIGFLVGAATSGAVMITTMGVIGWVSIVIIVKASKSQLIPLQKEVEETEDEPVVKEVSPEEAEQIKKNINNVSVKEAEQSEIPETIKTKTNYEEL